MSVTLSRRGLLTGQGLCKTQSVSRPPWALAEEAFIHACTRCEKCHSACETQIIVKGSGGFPQIDFERGECTFCQQCVQSCPTQALSLAQGQPWQQHIQINTQCMTTQQIVCRSCADQCAPQAIRFQPQRGGVSQPSVDIQACNGCGACISTCPTRAISMQLSSPQGAL